MKSVAARTVSQEECDRIIARILAKSAETGLAACIAIVDIGGHLKALCRTDDATSPMCVSASIAKAITSLNSGRSSREFWEFVRGDEMLLASVPSLPGILALPGGLPILEDGVVIGAVGVAGMGIYTEDELLAQAGLAGD